MRSRPYSCLAGYLLLLMACTDGATDDAGDAGAPTGPTGETDGDCELEPIDLRPLVAECSPLSSDYRPTLASTASWPSCITDDGDYPLFGNSPSSIARTEAYEEIRATLLATSTPTPDDFTRARVVYAQDEGLESRVVRREDLHHPEIPMSDWDPGVDRDKQCTIADNVMKYPERCVGPARMAPLLNGAFAAGQLGEQSPRVLAERIDAGLSWFVLISIHKEAFTCTFKGPDCDSAWAYYTGGTNRHAGLGMAAQVREIDAAAHDAIWDGILAVRCWRDVYPSEQFSTLDDVPPEGQALFARAWKQLDDALWHGYARIVRDRLERQLQVCGVEAQANFAWLEVSGPVLAFEARRRDEAQSSTLEAAWSGGLPTQMQVEAAVEALDALFPCPEPLNE